MHKGVNKTIGILAHVDAGKTTFAEQILYNTKSIRQRGRVDHKNTFLDNNQIEKERGITIFSGLGIFEYNNSKYYLLDTPGHVDFSSEMERAIQVMDYAIIIISAVDGVEGHTETVWRLLRKYKIPTFFFINKIDLLSSDLNGVLEEIKINLTENICDITDSLDGYNIKSELIEFIAERDEMLLDKYLNNSFEFELWINSMKNMIKENMIFPCVSGSALQDINIESFLEKLDMLTLTSYSYDDEFSGRVYKVHHEESGTCITYIKALSGKLKVRDEISYKNGEENVCEKITGIRIYSGNKYKAVDEVFAGEIFAITGLSFPKIGQGLGILKEDTICDVIPTLTSKVEFDQSINIKQIIRCFKILELEDPSLNIVWNEKLKELHIHVMGIVQLEVLESLVKERFNISVSFKEPNILYKETIDEISYGYGHFEPLKHYAEVHLRLEPSKRGSGISFKSECHADALTIGHQNLIGHYIKEREHNGLLTRNPITDINVALITGRAHNKHTSGGDFREATYRALRQGLEKVKNILLEPYYEFKIKVELEDMGRVLSDIKSAYGSFEPPKIIRNKAIIQGQAPVATIMNYSIELASFTRGKGTISLIFCGYKKCHNEEDIIKKIGYDKNADIEYTSTSIFCSKGQSFLVPWDKAEEFMHCDVN